VPLVLAVVVLRLRFIGRTLDVYGEGVDAACNQAVEHVRQSILSGEAVIPRSLHLVDDASQELLPDVQPVQLLAIIRRRPRQVEGCRRAVDWVHLVEAQQVEQVLGSVMSQQDTTKIC
jgi:hypothetical protein